MSESNSNNQSASKESVALQLTHTIALAEGVSESNPNFRRIILNLYAECLEATSGLRIADSNQ